MSLYCIVSNSFVHFCVVLHLKVIRNMMKDDKSRADLYKEIIEKKRKQMESSPFYRKMKAEETVLSKNTEKMQDTRTGKSGS